MNYYDEIAEGYEELHKEEQLKKLDLIMGNVNEALVDGPILDVGCATGFSLDILAKNYSKSCVGIDPSKKLIEKYTGDQEIILGCAEELPFPDDNFSLIVSITAIQNFSDVLKGITEIRRVAKNGCIIVITCLKKSSKLEEVTAGLAENFTVEAVLEEDKDLVYICRKL